MLKIIVGGCAICRLADLCEIEEEAYLRVAVERGEQVNELSSCVRLYFMLRERPFEGDCVIDNELH